MNIVTLSGTLVGREAVRFTPAGIEVFEGTFHHRVTLKEAGRPRIVEFDFPAVSYGELANELNQLPLGGDFVLKGFFAPRSSRSQRLIVHITEYNSRS